MIDPIDEKNIVKKVVRKLYKPDLGLPEVNNVVAYHTHNNIDSPQIDYRNLLNRPIIPSQSFLSTSEPKTATFVVGPSSNSDSATYDYTTTGTNDDVQIQAAIDALPTNGGSICLREGTYTLGSASVTIAKNGVEIFGTGKGTIVTCKTNFNLSLFKLGHASTQYTNCIIRDIYFDGNQTNQSSGDIIDNESLTKRITNLIVKDCYFINAYSNSVGSSEVGTIISNNYFYNWKSGSNAINCSSAKGSLVIGNYFNQSNTGSPYVTGCYEVEDNYFEVPDNYNATAISCISCVGNYVHAGNSMGSACIAVTANHCTGNIITTALSSDNTASIAIQANTNSVVSGNYIAGFGKQIYSLNGLQNITGNSLLNSYADAVVLSRTGSGYQGLVTVSGNRIQDPGQTTNNTYAGIFVTGGGSVGSNPVGVSITGNSITSDVTISKRMKYGINEDGTTPCVIIGNVVTGAVTQGVLATNVNTDVSHNITS